MRNLNTIDIIDPVQKRMVWALTGAFRAQHEPSRLPQGSMLLFDNLAALDRSPVVELDPMSQRIVWEYSGPPGSPRFSPLFGPCQRLATGNTIVTVSEFGLVLEVTPDHEIVWEFVSPHTAGERNELVAVIPELTRLPADFPVGRFAGAGAAPRTGSREWTELPGRRQNPAGAR